VKTIKTKVDIPPEGYVRLELDCSDLPTGEAEAVITVRPVIPPKKLKWTDLAGIGKEIWEGMDIQKYVDELRSERSEIIRPFERVGPDGKS